MLDDRDFNLRRKWGKKGGDEESAASSFHMGETSEELKSSLWHELTETLREIYVDK